MQYTGEEIGEEELSSGVRIARKFNFTTALQDARDAKRYLEAADKAASRELPRKPIGPSGGPSVRGGVSAKSVSTCDTFFGQ